MALNTPTLVHKGHGFDVCEQENHLSKFSRGTIKGTNKTTIIRAEANGQFGGLKSAEVWSFDFGLRVGITAIEAQQKNASESVGLRKTNY